MEKENHSEKERVNSSAPEKQGDTLDSQKEHRAPETSGEIHVEDTEIEERIAGIVKDDQEMETATKESTSGSPTQLSTSENSVNTLTAEPDIQKEDQEKETSSGKNTSHSPTRYSTDEKSLNTRTAELDIQKDDQETESVPEKSTSHSPTQLSTSEKSVYTLNAGSDIKDDPVKETDKTFSSSTAEEGDTTHAMVQSAERIGEILDVPKEGQVEAAAEVKSRDINKANSEVKSDEVVSDSNEKKGETANLKSENLEGKKNLEEVLYEEEEEPVFDGTEVPGMEAYRSSSSRLLDPDPESPGSVWPEKAAALKNFVKEKSIVAVSSVLRRLSGKSDDVQNVLDEGDKNGNINSDTEDVLSKESEVLEVSQKIEEKSGWNPLSLIGVSRAADADNKVELKEEDVIELVKPVPMKGRIVLYTRLGCQDCKEARKFLHRKRLRYVEVNIDVYPTRKLELERIAGSSAVPRVFFNEVLIGGLNELTGLEASGKLDEKIEYVITEVPSFEAPPPPLSGEDDMSGAGGIDELAVIVRKMKEYVVVKDRFYKMRRVTNCFLGSEAVDFLSEDQYLEREEAIEFGRKLASKLFFQHVLDENVFEDDNHLYRFLDHDPLVSQCQNIPRGIIEVKPKPITEISSRLRFLSYAIFEAYTSDDGKHVDYRSIHGSEEFARYLRTVEELQRVNVQDMAREERLAFFINLYNMMTIHAILVWGHPVGAMERRKLFGEFKYVIGGCTYSLSAIHNGILRGNQRPPYNLIKPFGVRDKRFKVALPYPEPLVHFSLVSGNRSAPALRCYSPGNIDKELVEAAHDFLRSGALTLDLDAKVASVSKILRWYSVDFGKNEVEVLKHAANYLEPMESQALLELLANTQLKVVYQPYDWGLNY